MSTFTTCWRKTKRSHIVQDHYRRSIKYWTWNLTSLKSEKSIIPYDKNTIAWRCDLSVSYIICNSNTLCIEVGLQRQPAKVYGRGHDYYAHLANWFSVVTSYFVSSHCNPDSYVLSTTSLRPLYDLVYPPWGLLSLWVIFSLGFLIFLPYWQI